MFVEFEGSQIFANYFFCRRLVDTAWILTCSKLTWSEQFEIIKHYGMFNFGHRTVPNVFTAQIELLHQNMTFGQLAFLLLCSCITWKLHNQLEIANTINIANIAFEIWRILRHISEIHYKTNNDQNQELDHEQDPT